ncbi:MAG: hypothetical protein KCHDKBKB_02102 [Elusimicrobia bacterium]|nr:hypothetical protein [Elusimicrobiota bacterium]
MKFIIDANLPNSVGESLAMDGHDVIYARNLLPSPASDNTVYKLASREKGIILTRDLDFSNIIAFDARETGGIIVLRTFLLSINEICATIKKLIAVLSEEEIAGRLIVLEPGRFRIHTPSPDDL